MMVGAGHTHALALKYVSQTAREQGATVTLISGEKFMPYSGMVPGVVAGLYPKRALLLDVASLAVDNQVEFIPENVVALDLHLRQVRLESGATVSYDYLSLNVGGDCKGVVSEEGGDVMPVKPVMPFLQWLERWQKVKYATCAVIGGGIAGVEIALSLDARLRKRGRIGGVYLVGRNRDLVPGKPTLARILHKLLVRRGISQLLGVPAQTAVPGAIQLADGTEYRADYVIVATGVKIWPGLAGSGLEVDERGCVVVNQWLQSVSHPDIFACGDCASWYRNSMPKSGVLAVRQAHTLGHNLAASLADGVFQPWETAQAQLAIVCTGNRSGVAHTNGRTFKGRLVWLWKDYLDRKFMRKFA